MSREKVARLRQLLSEAVPTAPAQSIAENEAWRAFQHFESFNPIPPAPQNRRARRMREIQRIAAWYGWTDEVQREIDESYAESMGSLPDERLDALYDRMRNLEECAQHGIGAPDAPPAS
ncbi:MAG: hypothetical protein J0L59_01480 [Xanthomonadales bacterium]|nr:hypothetical protein [Xanthomonadales bacterium]